MANPATIADLEARWRPLTADEDRNARALLDDAWAILQNQAPGIDARLLAGTASATATRAVVCAMVLRVLRNPDGKRSESIDDYSWTLDNAVSAGALYVSPDELRLVEAGRAGLGPAYVVSLGG